MCTDSDLYRGAYLPRLGWSLPKIYQGVYTYCTATQWPFDLGRSLKEIWVCIAFRGCPKGFWSHETGVHDSPCVGLCRLYQTLSARDRCIQGWTVEVLSQKQANRWYHPVTYGSRDLTPHEKNYHSTKLEFLALKWVVTRYFKEYLLYQPFLVKTDNNPLTYIMTTLNLDATGHWWVGALEWFNFKLEYQKGSYNTVVDYWAKLPPDWILTWWHQSLME